MNVNSLVKNVESSLQYLTGFFKKNSMIILSFKRKHLFKIVLFYSMYCMQSVPLSIDNFDFRKQS